MHAWALELQAGGGAATWAPVANGTSIGHKHIVMPLNAKLAAGWAAMGASTLRLTVTKTDPRGAAAAAIKSIELF